ncbi:hypothetical protein F4801DRAFT_558347 [Xylaria longipes]|nr:hypothetical protein F4801DRAFT_558347 [Xylaria longipes]
MLILLSLRISTFTRQAIRSATCIKTDSTADAWVRTAQIIYNKEMRHYYTTLMLRPPRPSSRGETPITDKHLFIVLPKIVRLGQGTK